MSPPGGEDAPRIPLLPPEEAGRRAEESGLLPLFADLSVFRMALHNPPVAKGLGDLLWTLLGSGRLDARLRELVIMRIGWVTGSEYEWSQHWRVASQLGLEPDDVVGVRDWERHPGYGERERAILQATDDVIGTGVVAPSTWALLRRHFDDDGVLFEIVVAICNWQLFANLLRSLRVPLEPGVEPWPPDGALPGSMPSAGAGR
ncbi:carboxymuconolactone decarboxylase family protein [Acidiferrimicrobium sp. IK]|uniref:carboxymuconolactone decarboxylase family protein n=1 Tax=Acidiferrimicrobium sp. IK TaxID=2871700 RepID=UPI0021CB3417|nr:carboxymuconolactone decarboxylase family protein [Acidiferrimicrobium sp. IK]MCU4187458.1 carboxymuconolactone decarboxylase family protein [Acidiferrimicrobium sp. IK]